MRMHAVIMFVVLAAVSVRADEIVIPGIPPPPVKNKEEIVVYRNLFSLMSATTFRPDSRMTLPDRSWSAVECRWDITSADPRIEIMQGIRYERFRLLQESHDHDWVQSADTGIHAVSYRKYFGLSLMLERIHFGAGANIGAAWEFSTYTEYDPVRDVYTDARRKNRMMLYPGVVIYLGFRPTKLITFNGEAMVNAFINDTITPHPRLSLGIGLRL